MVALRKHCRGNRSGRRRGFEALRSCVRDGACQYEVQEEDRQEFRSLQSLLGFPRFVQHLDLPPTLEAFPRWTLRLGEIIRLDADRHIPSVIGWLRLWFRQRRRCTISPGCQPSRTVQSSATGNLLSVSFCTLHTSCQEFRSLLRAVNACK